MNNDIVARLRVFCNWFDAGSYDNIRNDIRQAADEIERLRARVAELEAERAPAP